MKAQTIIHRARIAQTNARDDLVVIPASETQDGLFMGLPNSTRSHDAEIPSNDEAIRVASEQPLISPDKSGCMDLGLVASQNGAKTGYAAGAGHCGLYVFF